MTSNLAVELTDSTISIVTISVSQMFMGLELFYSIHHLQKDLLFSSVALKFGINLLRPIEINTN